MSAYNFVRSHRAVEFSTNQRVGFR